MISIFPIPFLIEQHHIDLCDPFRYVERKLDEIPNVFLLGPTGVPRLSIFSFVIRHPGTGLFLHHNFVCSLLDNVFGIQSRAGCMCAGPYALELLGIQEDLASRFEKILLEDSDLDRNHLRRRREYSSSEMLR